MIKKLGHRPEFVLPDRGDVTMAVPFMRSYCELLVKTCHARGAFAMGGMAAFIPSRRDPEVNAVALAKVREDKEREASQGFDGTWVAHPDLVPVAMEAFDRVLGERPNQIDRRRDDVQVSAADLLDVARRPGEITEQGLRNNVSVGIQYLAAWLNGNGAAAINNLMEDAATAEISRSQIWQWLHHGKVTLDSVQSADRRGGRSPRPRLRRGTRALRRGRDSARVRRVPHAARVRTAGVTIDEAQALWSPDVPYLNTATYRAATPAGLGRHAAGAHRLAPRPDELGGVERARLDRARRLFAQMVPSPSSASPSARRCGAVGLVAASVARGRVVAPEGEFTSLSLALARARLRAAHSPALARLADRIDDSTTVVAGSASCSRRTARSPTSTRSRPPHARTEPSSCSTPRRPAAGSSSTPRAFDAVACAGYKWLCTPRGTRT